VKDKGVVKGESDIIQSLHTYKDSVYIVFKMWHPAIDLDIIQKPPSFSSFLPSHLPSFSPSFLPTCYMFYLLIHLIFKTTL
jgi:hypothetical protein